MKEITLTCPFTGVEFNATEYADGRIVFIHPLTRETIHMNFNSSINKYNLPKSAFKPIKTCTQIEASEILGISRQRVNKIIQDETIPSHLINGNRVFLLDDILSYKETRKIGRPAKE